MIATSLSQLVTEHVYLDLGEFVPGSTTLVKLEGMNPAGSIKLKTATALVAAAEQKRGLVQGSHLIESSSGNLGVALSMICGERGYRFTCVCDLNTSLAHIAAMRALRAEVVIVRGRDDGDGFLGTRIDYVHSRLRADPGMVWLNQYANPANVAVHAGTTAAAMDRAIPDIDYVFAGAGSTGTVMGCVRYFRVAGRPTRVVAVDSAGSVTFGGPSGPRFVPGIGTSRRPALWDTEQPHDVVLVDELAAIAMCRRVARRFGVLFGGSTGSVLAAVEWYADRIEPGSRVVAISPDFGERYLANVYDDGWVRERFDASPESLPPRSGVRAAAVRAT